MTTRGSWCVQGLLVVFVMVGCGAGDAPAGEPSAETEPAEPLPPGCVAPAGVDTSPTTIDSAVALLNSLPFPVSLPCFVESLERPLFAYATSNAFSAQPGEERSPRLFLFSDALTMSIVFDGPGSHLLEFGEAVDERFSLKGEIEFPVAAAVPATAPFDQVRVGSGTTCTVCHEGEQPVGGQGMPGSYISEALQPPPDTKLSLSFARAYASDCVPADEPERCALLTAAFARGEVLPGEFPPATRVCTGI